ncbi:MAG: hypothetical protein AAB796_00585 [Patescibacteria group bacterium]
MNDFLNAIINSIRSFPYQEIVFYGQIIGGVLSVLFIAGTLYAARRMEAMHKGSLGAARKAISGESHDFQRRVLKKVESEKAWQNIIGKIHSHNASDWLLSVIQADSLFDDILKHMGLPGETMGDRLKQLDTGKLASLDAVWEAHKIRNKVAHTPATLLRRDELLRAVEGFRKGLSELGYLEE